MFEPDNFSLDINDWLSSEVNFTKANFTVNNVIRDSRCRSHYLKFCELKYVVAVMGAIISLITVGGNTLVMLAFYLDRQIRHPSNLFLCSLAASDFLIGVFSIPFLSAYIYANQKWPLNNFFCNVWLSLDYSLCLTSIYNMLFITVDRFCSVKFPAKYRKIRTKSRVKMMIYISWALPSIIFFGSTFLYPRLSKDGKENFDPETGLCDARWKENRIFNVILTVVYFWLTLTVMIILYILIYQVARKLERKSRQKAAQMASLVGMAGATMTNIGICVTKTSKNDQSHSITEENGSSSTISQYGEDQKLGDVCTTTEGSSSKNDESVEGKGASDKYTADKHQIGYAIISEKATKDSFKTYVKNINSKRGKSGYVEILRSTAVPLKSITNIFRHDSGVPKDSINKCKISCGTTKTFTNVKLNMIMAHTRPEENQETVRLFSNSMEMKRNAADGEESSKTRSGRNNENTFRRSIQKIGFRMSKDKMKNRNKARKSLRIITFILGAFIICWLPWHLYSIVYNFCEACQSSAAATHLYLLFYYMCYLNSPINPFCYALANQQFKKTFYRILRFDCRRL